jgi:hypothetical protein
MRFQTGNWHSGTTLLSQRRHSVWNLRAPRARNGLTLPTPMPPSVAQVKAINFKMGRFGEAHVFMVAAVLYAILTASPVWGQAGTHSNSLFVFFVFKFLFFLMGAQMRLHCVRKCTFYFPYQYCSSVLPHHIQI